MDSAEQAEICRSFRTVHGLLNSGIFHQENIGHILLRSAFIDLLISLRALMWKSDNYSKRISFTDDVSLVGKVKDVTDLIKYVRDAVCHPDSANLRIGSGVIAPFSVHFGKGPIVQLGGCVQQSLYEDDVYFTFGGQGIYLFRHIIRAFEEAKANLLPLIDERRRPKDI